MKLLFTSLFIKILTIISGYILVIFAQNNLSVNDAGLLYRMISIIPFLSIFLLYGLDFFVVKNFSGCIDARANIYSTGLLSQFAKKIFYRSFVMLLVSCILASTFGPIGNYELEYLILSIIFATCVSFLILIGELHKCMGRYFIGSVIVSGVIPLFCVFIFHFYDFTVEWTLTVAYSATVVLYLLISVFTRNKLTETIKSLSDTAIDKLDSSMVFYASGFNQLILMLPTFFAGFLLLDKELAIIYPILRFSLLFQTGLAAVNVYLGPKISRAYNANNIIEFKNLSRLGSFVGFVSCLIFIIGTIIFNERVLFIFAISPEYKVLLFIILVGQSFNAITGPVLLSLIYSANESSAFIVNSIIGMIAILLLPISYAEAGLLGFCLATSAIVSGLNLCYLIHLKMKMGFWIYPKYCKWGGN